MDASANPSHELREIRLGRPALQVFLRHLVERVEEDLHLEVLRQRRERQARRERLVYQLREIAPIHLQVGPIRARPPIRARTTPLYRPCGVLQPVLPPNDGPHSSCRPWETYQQGVGLKLTSQAARPYPRGALLFSLPLVTALGVRPQTAFRDNLSHGAQGSGR